MIYASIDELRSQLGAPPQSPEYTEKMMHPIPDADSADRVKFILERCAGKRVLEFGASGSLHERLKEVTAELMGVDRQAGDGVMAFDLDAVHIGGLPFYARAELIVCGEIIEHLSNPGHFLVRLKEQYRGIPVIITTPNAFTDVGRKHLSRGIENVNKDHVAWYSYKTLSTLLTRAGFTIDEFLWYGGDGPTAQGLIMVVS